MCNRYVVKDGHYVSFGINVQQFLAARRQRKSTKGDLVMRLIEDGKNLREITGLHPGYSLVHMRQIKAMISESRQWRHNTGRSNWVAPPPLDALLGIDASQKVIIKWLHDNIRRPRVFKQPALWIWGDVDMGKTSFLNWLDTMLKIYWIPKVRPLLSLTLPSHKRIVVVLTSNV